jgi:hypothetical protein
MGVCVCIAISSVHCKSSSLACREQDCLQEPNTHTVIPKQMLHAPSAFFPPECPRLG